MYDLETGSDSGREWVEVFNAGATSATLTEWKVFEGSTNHSIAAHTGGEVLASSAYAILADNPAKFLEDWPSYTGPLFDSAFSLSNTGETLVLRCCGSDLADKDSVTYSSENGASGDGNALSRKNASSASFISAAPTPGTGPLTASEGSGNSSDSGQTTTTSNQTQTTEAASSSGTSAVSSYVPPPGQDIFADAGNDRVVIVGADTEFRGRAYDRKKEVLTEKVRFSWNFGDGSTAEGQSVLHHYDYPGKYAVVLSIAQGTNAAGDRIIVAAEPARLAFSTLPDGSVAIENMAGRDLDLSHWIVRQLGRDFILPDNSVILAGSSMRISQKTLGFWSGPSAELAYPNGFVALHAGERAGDVSSSTPPVSPAKKAVSPAPSVTRAEPVYEISAVEPEVVKVPDERTDTPAPDAGTATSSSQVAAIGSTFSSSSLWWLGALGIAGLAAGSIVFARRFGKKEWDIVEETGETG